MPHFRAIADAAIDSAQWRHAVGGLVALRLVDVWAAGAALPEEGLRALDRVIKMMDVGAPERIALGRLLVVLQDETIRRTGPGAWRVLLPLSDYADAQTDRGEWSLAIDAHRTILQHAVTLRARPLDLRAYLHLGLTLSDAGRYDDALTALQTGRSAAAISGNVVYELTLEESEAIVEWQFGNDAAANAILESVATDPAAASVHGLRAGVLHLRGKIAYRRRDPVRALSWYAQSLDTYDRDADVVGVLEADVDEVLFDCALALLDIGYHDVARDVLRVLGEAAVMPTTRDLARIAEKALRDGKHPLEVVDFGPPVRSPSTARPEESSAIPPADERIRGRAMSFALSRVLVMTARVANQVRHPTMPSVPKPRRRPRR